MNIDKWKKKPLKKELYDIIKLQEERISKLNKEKAHIEIAYEEDYKEQQQEIERLNNIIKHTDSWIDRTIEIIKQQPSEDDTWILERLNGIKQCLKGSDKE